MTPHPFLTDLDMTQRELTEKWLRSIGRHLEGGTRKGDDLAAILPFLILDMFYSYYQKGIAKHPLHHESKALARKMSVAYNRINKSFFAAFSPDEWDEVIDVMDTLEDYVANDVTIAETGVWNVFKTYPETDYLVALYMCNMLAKAAQTVWMVVYRNARREPVANRDIDTLLYTSKRLAELELGSTEIDARDEAKVRNLRAATDILGRKIVQFVREQPTTKIKDNV